MLLFLFATDQRHIFCSSWSRGINEIYPCFKNVFANCRSVTLKERDTVNGTANLSTWRHLTSHSMIPESGIKERRNQRHVSRLRRPFPLPRPPLGSLRSPIFFLFRPVFCLFLPLRNLVPGWVTIPLWLRYVDDTFTAVHKDELNDFMNTLTANAFPTCKKADFSRPGAGS